MIRQRFRLDSTVNLPKEYSPLKTGLYIVYLKGWVQEICLSLILKQSCAKWIAMVLDSM